MGAGAAAVVAFVVVAGLVQWWRDSVAPARERRRAFERMWSENKDVALALYPDLARERYEPRRRTDRRLAGRAVLYIFSAILALVVVYLALKAQFWAEKNVGFPPRGYPANSEWPR